MASSNVWSDLVSPSGLNAGFGRGCLRESFGRGSLREGIPGPFSSTGEGGEEDSVEQAENQGYPLTVSFQTFESVVWCKIEYIASMTTYASTRTDVGVEHRRYIGETYISM